MAWYYGTFSCGHEGRTNVIGPSKNRQYIIDRRFSGLCEECYFKWLEEEKERKSEEALQAAKEMEIPQLVGTEKQIAWANTIRQELIEKANNQIEESEGYNKERFILALDNILNTKTEARWYIDNKEAASFTISIRSLLMTTYEKIKNELKEQTTTKVEVIKEGTVSPTEVKYPGIVQITSTKEKITATYEKNDKFREIVKNLNFKWNDRNWERTLSELTGTYIDRAAELGNKLLNAGFSICILDEEIRERAIDGEFEVECYRWIKYDKDSNKLAIRWYDKNDYMYNAARKIKSSKWKSEIKSVTIDISHYEEVQEFAEMYKCKFTDKALEFIEQYKNELANIPKVEPVKTKDNIKEDGLQNILNSSREILEDLREDD